MESLPKHLKLARTAARPGEKAANCVVSLRLHKTWRALGREISGEVEHGLVVERGGYVRHHLVFAGPALKVSKLFE